jgi:hypothetical protein
MLPMTIILSGVLGAMLAGAMINLEKKAKKDP